MDINNNLYEELYHLSDTKIIVLDKKNNKTCLKKVLSYYQEEVFKYLKNNHNIHIPVIYDYYKQDDKLIVIEEYIQGETLDSLLNKNKLNDQEKRNVLKDVMEALIFLHNSNPTIIHRDLKASNIIVNEDGLTKLIDFDAAKHYQEGKDKDTLLIGTPGSAAPEQYGFGQSDQRTDIYALGILMQEMFPLDKQINKIANKATSIDPNNRYQNVQEIYNYFINNKNDNKDHKTFKLIIEILLAIMFIAASLTSSFQKNGIELDGIKLYINRFFFCIALLVGLEIIVDSFNIFKFLPYYHNENKYTRILSRIFFAILFFVIMAIFASILETIF